MLNKMLLGTAAVLVTVAGAQAADLPSKKAAPVNYVKICDTYGAGYFFIPGSDTCLKIGGLARAEYLYHPAGNAVLPTAAPTVGKQLLSTNATGGNNFYYIQPTQVSGNGMDTTGTTIRGVLTLDARTATSMGTARTFIALRGTNASGINGNASLTGNFGMSAQAHGFSLERAYVQFAGFTFGRQDEVFSYMPGNNYGAASWSGFSTGLNAIAYTAVLGGGVSATVAIQDRTALMGGTSPATSLFVAPVTGDPNLYAGTLTASTQANSGALLTVANGPMTIPSLAGNIKIEQSWGNAQIMGSVMQNSAIVTGASIYTGAGAAGNANSPIVPVQTYNNTFLTTGGNSGSAITKTGYSIGAGVKFNLPMISAGDALFLTAAYADGDLEHLGNTGTSARGGSPRELTGLIRNDRNLYVTPTAYSTTAAGTGVVTAVRAESAKGWSVGGIFQHFWTPQVRSSFWGSYLSITPPTSVQNTDWIYGGLSKASLTMIGHTIVWSPVKDLNLGLETAYGRLSQSRTSFNSNGVPTAGFTAPNVTGANSATNTIAVATAAVPVLPVKVSPSLFSVRLRADRAF